MMTVKDGQSRYVYANKQARRHLKVEPGRNRQLCDADVFAPASAQRAVAHDQQALSNRSSVDYHADLELVDGTKFFAHVVKSVLTGTDGKPYVVTAIYNLSELASAKQSALDAERRFETLVESAPYGILLHRSDRVIYANSEAAKLLGFKTAEDLIGQCYRDMMTPESQRAYDEANQQRADGHGPADFLECNFRRQDGMTLQAEVFKRRVPYEGATAVLVHLRDISERKSQERRLQQIATRDALTGLPNRHFIQDEAQRVLDRAREHEESAAFIFIDLDHFKRINDSHGHTAGDELIRQVAHRLTTALRRADSIGRLGGDEFVVVLENTDRTTCERVAERLLERLRAPFLLDGAEVYSGASLGVAMYPQAGQTVDELLKAADTAMYHAKADGRFTYKFFEARMHEQALRNMWLDTGLRQALEQGQFELHYQPKVSTQTGRTVGLEALVRWRHPQRGLISPGEFIPFAEESGLIGTLGEWVIREACGQIATWTSQGLPIPVAVNLSARQLARGSIVDTIRDAIREAGIDPRLMEIELTESALVQDEALALQVLTALQALGCPLYLDDFGTGYSSLSQLSKFSMDAFKVDRSFVARMCVDSKAAALVESMVHISRALKMKIVAEGVETPQQLEMLKALGCETVQGYLFARPMPASEIPSYLHRADVAYLRLVA